MPPPQWLQRFVVCLEEYGELADYSHHLHAFLEFRESCFINDLRLFHHPVFPNNTDVQVVKNEKGTIKYCTKTDEKPLMYNVSMSLTHDRHQFLDYCQKNANFQLMDPLIFRLYPNYRHFLNKAFDEQQQKARRAAITPFVLPTFCYRSQWAFEVQKWFWNFFNSPLPDRLKQMYVWGPHEMGKSGLIRKHLFCDEPQWFDYIFFAAQEGKFVFEGLDVAFHKVIVMEEMSFHNYNVSILKRLLEGQPVVLDRKGQKARLCTFRGPIILISNVPPPATLDPALRSRFDVVHADHVYHVLRKCIFDPGEDNVMRLQGIFEPWEDQDEDEDDEM